MIEMNEAIIAAFPLRGEWLSPNTPGTKIPSHGTNQLGTRYAYDFIQVDWNRKGYPAYRVSVPRYFIWGVSLNEYYCWGQEVYSPCDGTVVTAADGWVERTRTNLISDMVNAYNNAHYFDPEKKVGHSGNSFAPHLHFQFMDSSDIATANGLPCAFEEYELFKGNTWVKVTNGIPTNRDRIKFGNPTSK